MSAPALLHLPAQVVQWLLVGAGVGSDPTDVSSGALGPWPVYADFTPDGDGVPDEVLTVTDTDAVDDGQSTVDGEPYQHYGFQIRVRAKTADVGRAKAEAVRKYLAETPRYAAGTGDVTVPARPGGQPAATYRVYNFARVVPVRRLGQDNPRTKRQLFTVNAVAPVRLLFPRPAAYYPFDGSATDASGNGHDLTPAGAGYGAGKFGSALTAGTGSNPGPVMSATGTGRWSVGGWFKAGAADDVHVTVSDASDDNHALSLAPDGTVTASVQDGNTSVTGTATGAGYHLLVMVGDAGTLRLYVDGVAAGTDAIADADPITGNLLVDSGSGGLDDVFLADHALTAAQVAYLWNSGTGRPYPA